MLSMEVQRERNRFEDTRWREKKPRPIPTNQVEQYLLPAFKTRKERFLIQSVESDTLFYGESRISYLGKSIFI